MEAVVVHEDAGSLLPSVFADGWIGRQGQRHCLREDLLHHVVDAGDVLVWYVGELLVDKLVLDHEHVLQHVDEEEGVALVLHLVKNRHRHLIHHVVEAGTVLVRCVGELLVDKLVLDHEHVQQHVDDELHLMQVLLEEEGVALVLHLVKNTSNQLGFLIGTD